MRKAEKQKRFRKYRNLFSLLLAVRTRLELATPCVTGMYSNQLNYRTILSSSLFTTPLKSLCKDTTFFETTKTFWVKNEKKQQNTC